MSSPDLGDWPPRWMQEAEELMEQIKSALRGFELETDKPIYDSIVEYFKRAEGALRQVCREDYEPYLDWMNVTHGARELGQEEGFSVYAYYVAFDCNEIPLVAELIVKHYSAWLFQYVYVDYASPTYGEAEASVDLDELDRALKRAFPKTIEFEEFSNVEMEQLLDKIEEAFREVGCRDVGVEDLSRHEDTRYITVRCDKQYFDVAFDLDFVEKTIVRLNDLDINLP